MKIYTKGGDAGKTSLFGGRRVDKCATRVEAYGDIDELNAAMGVARAAARASALDVPLLRIQSELFTLGARLAAADESARAKLPAIESSWIAVLESEIDAAVDELPPLRHFVLPGGCESSATLHLARTICRRAERAIVALSLEEPVESELIIYVNRLSDWLFTMARLANHRAQVVEPQWDPSHRG